MKLLLNGDVVVAALDDEAQVELLADRVEMSDMVYGDLNVSNASLVTVASVPVDFEPGRFHYINGVFTPIPQPVDEAKRAAMIANINAERDRREAEHFPYQGKQLDCNTRSVQRITAAALAAQAALAANQPFALDWTCADNSVLALDAAGVAGIPTALAAHAASLHTHAKALKARATAAEWQHELDTININQGWPT